MHFLLLLIAQFYTLLENQQPETVKKNNNKFLSSSQSNFNQCPCFVLKANDKNMWTETGGVACVYTLSSSLVQTNSGVKISCGQLQRQRFFLDRENILFLGFLLPVINLLLKHIDYPEFHFLSFYTVVLVFIVSAHILLSTYKFFTVPQRLFIVLGHNSQKCVFRDSRAEAHK